MNSTTAPLRCKVPEFEISLGVDVLPGKQHTGEVTVQKEECFGEPEDEGGGMD